MSEKIILSALKKIKKQKPKSFTRLMRLLYLKLFRIHDTPHRIAMGLSLGVFSGIMPGIGVVGALFLAFLLRVNRAAAIAGSLLTNTWLGLVTLLLSMKIGSAILNVDWHQIQQKWRELIKDFHFKDLLQRSTMDIIMPVVIGSIVVAVVVGILTYFIAKMIINHKNHQNSRHRAAIRDVPHHHQ